MIIQRLVVLFLLFILLDCHPIQQNIRKYDYRQRRSLDIRSWQFIDILYKRLYKDENQRNDDEEKSKRAEVPLEFRPIEGPISIEQLPAMLAARYVKRYPFSQHADPGLIGR